MNQLIAFFILFSTCLQQPEKTFTSYPECGDFCTDLKFEISKFGIKVKWGIIDLQEVTRVEVERSRDAQNFATIATLGADAAEFDDKTAMFGIFFYRLKISTPQEVVFSEVIESEVYLGQHSSQFLTVTAANPERQVNLMLGNTSFANKVWVGIYSTKAELLGPFRQVELERQLLKIQTDSLHAGQYAYVIKQEDLPVRIYRLDIK